MSKTEFKALKIGDMVEDDLSLTQWKIVDIDENGFVLENGVYYVDVLDRFKVIKNEKV